MDARFEQMSDWLRNDLTLKISRITPASADASFRRYFRVHIAPLTPRGSVLSPLEGEHVVSRVQRDNKTFIVMDAPPDKEDCATFIRVAKVLYAMGLNVPRIEQANLAEGFLLLSDLGEDSYLSALSDKMNAEGRYECRKPEGVSVEGALGYESAHQPYPEARFCPPLRGGTLHPEGTLYCDAIDALIQMQKTGKREALILPDYDSSLLMGEMALFRDWLLARHLALQLSDSEQSMLATVFDLLIDNALSQPQVWVHRDYHCRNLMVCHNNSASNPGILDFQDAVLGPITYDLVSLLRDCYIEWPQAQQRQWRDYYCQRAEATGLLAAGQRDQFTRWFDLMGVQRHLKATGIFARLYQRDGKTAYMNDVPRTLSYICRLSDTHSELRGLIDLIEQRVLPLLPRHIIGPLNSFL